MRIAKGTYTFCQTVSDIYSDTYFDIFSDILRCFGRYRVFQRIADHF